MTGRRRRDLISDFSKVYTYATETYERKPVKSLVALPQPESSALSRQRDKMSVIRRNVSIIMALSFTVDNMSRKSA